MLKQIDTSYFASKLSFSLAPYHTSTESASSYHSFHLFHNSIYSSIARLLCNYFISFHFNFYF